MNGDTVGSEPRRGVVELLFALLVAARGAWLGILPFFLSQNVGLSPSDVGCVYAIAMLSQALFEMPSAALARKYGVRALVRGAAWLLLAYSVLYLISAVFGFRLGLWIAAPVMVAEVAYGAAQALLTGTAEAYFLDRYRPATTDADKPNAVEQMLQEQRQLSMVLQACVGGLSFVVVVYIPSISLVPTAAFAWILSAAACLGAAAVATRVDDVRQPAAATDPDRSGGVRAEVSAAYYRARSYVQDYPSALRAFVSSGAWHAIFAIAQPLAFFQLLIVFRVDAMSLVAASDARMRTGWLLLPVIWTLGECGAGFTGISGARQVIARLDVRVLQVFYSAAAIVQAAAVALSVSSLGADTALRIWLIGHLVSRICEGALRQKLGFASDRASRGERAVMASFAGFVRSSFAAMAFVSFGVAAASDIVVASAAAAACSMAIVLSEALWRGDSSRSRWIANVTPVLCFSAVGIPSLILSPGAVGGLLARYLSGAWVESMNTETSRLEGRGSVLDPEAPALAVSRWRLYDYEDVRGRVWCDTHAENGLDAEAYAIGGAGSHDLRLDEWGAQFTFQLLSREVDVRVPYVEQLPFRCWSDYPVGSYVPVVVSDSGIHGRNATQLRAATLFAAGLLVPLGLIAIGYWEHLRQRERADILAARLSVLRSGERLCPPFALRAHLDLLSEFRKHVGARSLYLAAWGASEGDVAAGRVAQAWIIGVVSSANGERDTVSWYPQPAADSTRAAEMLRTCAALRDEYLRSKLNRQYYAYSAKAGREVVPWCESSIGAAPVAPLVACWAALDEHAFVFDGVRYSQCGLSVADYGAAQGRYISRSERDLLSRLAGIALACHQLSSESLNSFETAHDCAKSLRAANESVRDALASVTFNCAIAGEGGLSLGSEIEEALRGLSDAMSTVLARADGFVDLAGLIERIRRSGWTQETAGVESDALLGSYRCPPYVSERIFRVCHETMINGRNFGAREGPFKMFVGNRGDAIEFVLSTPSGGGARPPHLGFGMGEALLNRAFSDLGVSDKEEFEEGGARVVRFSISTSLMIRGGSAR